MSTHLEPWKWNYAEKICIKNCKNGSKPDYAPVHFCIDHVPCNVHITGTWTPIHAGANCLWANKQNNIIQLCISYLVCCYKGNKTNKDQYLLYDWRDGFQAAGSGRELAIKATCFHLATNEKLRQFNEASRGKHPHEGVHYLRKLLKGSCCFLVLIRGASNNNHWPVQRQHTRIMSDVTTGAMLKLLPAEVIPAVHVSVGHSTQSMNESRSWHHQAGPWSGYKQPQETATWKIQYNHRLWAGYNLLLTLFCPVTKCLTFQWGIQWQMLHNTPVVGQNVFYIKISLCS